MIIEIDEGTFVNLANVFKIEYKPFNNRGVWIFSGTSVAGETRELQAVSRQFSSAEEARTWLKNILYNFKGLSLYIEGSGTRENRRRRKELEIVDDLF